MAFVSLQQAEARRARRQPTTHLAKSHSDGSRQMPNGMTRWLNEPGPLRLFENQLVAVGLDRMAAGRVGSVR